MWCECSISFKWEAEKRYHHRQKSSTLRFPTVSICLIFPGKTDTLLNHGPFVASRLHCSLIASYNVSLHIRPSCRGGGGGAKPSRIDNAICRAAKETERRGGREVRHPCTVRAAVCDDKEPRCPFTSVYLRNHGNNQTDTLSLWGIKWLTLSLISQAKLQLQPRGWPLQVHRTFRLYRLIMEETELSFISDHFLCRSEGEDQQVKMKCYRWTFMDF